MMCFRLSYYGGCRRRLTETILAQESAKAYESDAFEGVVEPAAQTPNTRPLEGVDQGDEGLSGRLLWKMIGLVHPSRRI